MTFPGPPDPNWGFLTDVDDALKTKLNNLLTVGDEKGGNLRKVKFFFRWPQVEVTDQTFPFGTIDFLRFQRAADREMRSGDPQLLYAPPNYALPPVGSRLHTDEMPIPYDFIYQITLHSRFIWHDRQMSYQLLQNDFLPPRGGYLVVGEGDQQTIRPLFVDEGGPVDATGLDQEQGGRGKRHFRKVWTVRTIAELFQKDIETLTMPTTIVTTVTETDDPQAADPEISTPLDPEYA